MNVTRLAGWAVVIFAVWLIITNPTGAAHLARSVGTILGMAVHNVSVFLASI